VHREVGRDTIDFLGSAKPTTARQACNSQSSLPDTALITSMCRSSAHFEVACSPSSFSETVPPALGS
jgi:hypothetical protein